jgi:hypothetical protein
VEKIVNHRKNKYKTGEYEVEIKWKDYGMESNTWEDMREKILEVPDNFLEYYNTVSVQFKKDFEAYLHFYHELRKVFHQAKNRQHLYQKKFKTMIPATSTTRS